MTKKAEGDSKPSGCESDTQKNTDDRVEVFSNIEIEDISISRIEDWFEGLELEIGDRIIIKNISGCEIAHAFIKG